MRPTKGARRERRAWRPGPRIPKGRTTREERTRQEAGAGGGGPCPIMLQAYVAPNSIIPLILGAI